MQLGTFGLRAYMGYIWWGELLQDPGQLLAADRLQGNQLLRQTSYHPPNPIRSSYTQSAEHHPRSAASPSLKASILRIRTVWLMPCRTAPVVENSALFSLSVRGKSVIRSDLIEGFESLQALLREKSAILSATLSITAAVATTYPSHSILLSAEDIPSANLLCKNDWAIPV
ncbi:hypothetical protein M406DRAFT_330414 [Cryphonectria parasitica EP155]|uniref:Uncharacterized protein n=1 Tax=Cryphonectria parasitica (strain ATCC 38755 / EP155) TaxID=660469 RepID=A0A9P4Y4M5_CRYP1|nr:uncharacterized protein M406DRAFT_330414 [Cryphonectria parasitica EP155]KAF3766618.1 hypothetical protein M406DRAFT_330414 [Cryphonectria parasitica EP155]